MTPYRALDTMERLLTAVGASEQASEVRALRLEIELTADRGNGSPPGHVAARPERQVPVISAVGQGSELP